MDNPTLDDLIHVLENTMHAALLMREKLHDLHNRLAASSLGEREMLSVLEDVEEIMALCGDLPDEH